MKTTITVFVVFLVGFIVSYNNAIAGDDQYFVRHGANSENMGPYSESELRTRIKQGVVKPTDYIWSSSMKDWTQISKTKDFGNSRSVASDQLPPPFRGEEEKKSEPTQADITTPNPKQPSGYINPLVGLAFPVNNASGGPYFTIAGEVGIHTGIGDVGIFANTFGTSTTVSGITASASITTIMLSLTSQTGAFYYGGRFGLGIRSLTESNSTTSLGASGSSFAVAPVIGVRLPVANTISFTLETSWQVLWSGDISGNLGSASLPSVGYLVPLAGLSFKF